MRMNTSVAFAVGLLVGATITAGIWCSYEGHRTDNLGVKRTTIPAAIQQHCELDLPRRYGVIHFSLDDGASWKTPPAWKTKEAADIYVAKRNVEYAGIVECSVYDSFTTGTEQPIQMPPAED